MSLVYAANPIRPWPGLGILFLLALALMPLTGCQLLPFGESQAPLVAPVGIADDHLRVNSIRSRGLQLDLFAKPAAPRLPADRRIHLIAQLSNIGKLPQRLQFRSGQRIEVEVWGQERLYRWSDDRLFTQELGFLLLNPGEKAEFTAEVSTRMLVPNQEYRVEVYLLSHSDWRSTWRFVVGQSE